MAIYKLSSAVGKTISKIYEYSILSFGEKIADAYFTSLHNIFELLPE